MNKKTWTQLFSFILLVFGIILVGYFGRDYFHLAELEKMIQASGLWAPVIFIGSYIFAIVFLLPGSALTIIGGLVFGLWQGVLYSMIAAVVGGTLAFLIARFIAFDWVREKIGGKLKMLVEGVEAQGWKFVALMRLMPIVPFTLLNYALGLTTVRLITYVVASAIFMIPGCFAYTFVGSLGQEAIQGDIKYLIGKGLFAIGLLVLLSVLPWVWKQIKK